jgi:hypothetical protein
LLSPDRLVGIGDISGLKTFLLKGLRWLPDY